MLPDTNNDNAQTTGFDYGVQVFNNGAPIGFAFYTGAGNTWRFTATAGTINEGHNNFITAAVWVRDRATPNAIGTSDQQGPINALQITLDTMAPPVAFGRSGVPNDGLSPDSDSGVFSTDRITNDTTPTVFGRAEADAIVRVYADLNLNGVIEPGFDVFLGQTTAIPLDGDEAFPNGYWKLTSTDDLNNINFFSPPHDGLRQLLVSTEDAAGNVNNPNDGVPYDPDQILQIFIDTQGPTVDNVYIPGYPGFNLFQTKPNGANGPTPPITQLAIKFTDLPNRIAQFLYYAVQNDLALAPGNYSLVGDANGVIPIQSITIQNMVAAGNPAMAVVTLNFAKPLPDDRYTLTVFDRISDPAGNALDGNRDGHPGANYVARFTVDSHPEIGVYASQVVSVDINGNRVFDPANADATNRDLEFNFGLISDERFAGKFRSNLQPLVPDGRLYDVLGAYGFDPALGRFRFLFDFNGDGAVDYSGDGGAAQINGLAVAGNFDGNAANGDEIAIFDGVTWYFDLNRNFMIDLAEAATPSAGGVLPTGYVRGLAGYPIVGDFDGDGRDDLGAYQNDTFVFDLAADGLNGGVNAAVNFGFPGVADRPVAADMDADGVDDLGVWIPRSGAQPAAAQWMFLISNDFAHNRIPGTVNTLNHPFSPEPLGADQEFRFGDPGALPIVGNFDPPVSEVAAFPGGPDVVGRTSTGQWWIGHNTGSGFASQPYGGWDESQGWSDVVQGDFNNDGQIDVLGRAANGLWWLGQNTGQGFINKLYGAWDSSAGWTDVAAGDFNGDNRLDVIGRTAGGTWWAALNTGAGFTNTYMGVWDASANWRDVIAADFNHDGLTDMLGRTAGGAWWLATATNAGFANSFYGAWSGPAGWRDVQSGDFNGDGLTDVLGRTSTGQWWVGVNNGAALVNQYFGSWWEAAGWRDVMTGDFNNDGRDDVIGRTANGAWWLGQSSGALFTSTLFGSWNEASGWRDVTTGDFNNDGALDILGRSAAGAWQLGANAGAGKLINLAFGAWDSNAAWRDVTPLAAASSSPPPPDSSFGEIALAAELAQQEQAKKPATASDAALRDETDWLNLA